MDTHVRTKPENIFHFKEGTVVRLRNDDPNYTTQIRYYTNYCDIKLTEHGRVSSLLISPTYFISGKDGKWGLFFINYKEEGIFMTHKICQSTWLEFLNHEKSITDQMVEKIKNIQSDTAYVNVFGKMWSGCEIYLKSFILQHGVVELSKILPPTVNYLEIYYQLPNLAEVDVKWSLFTRNRNGVFNFERHQRDLNLIEKYYGRTS